MKICFLVVVYNKDLCESSTINSLLKISNKNYDCLIVNNGPNKIDLKLNKNSDNAKFNFVEYLDNKPLSIIYNDFFLRYFDFDRYVILDDDSILTNVFIDRVFEDNEIYYDLELPKIFDQNDKLYYPLKNWATISKSEFILNYNEDVIFSIGSGLVVSKKLVNKFKEKKINLFNESFAFYGVDFSFFWELESNDFGELIVTSKSKIIHNMSLHGEISDFKRSELYLNFALQIRHYPSIVNLKNFLYSLFLTLKLKKIRLFFDMLKAYIYARHPRC